MITELKRAAYEAQARLCKALLDAAIAAPDDWNSRNEFGDAMRILDGMGACGYGCAALRTVSLIAASAASVILDNWGYQDDLELAQSRRLIGNWATLTELPDGPPAGEPVTEIYEDTAPAPEIAEEAC